MGEENTPLKGRARLAFFKASVYIDRFYVDEALLRTLRKLGQVGLVE